MGYIANTIVYTMTLSTFDLATVLVKQEKQERVTTVFQRIIVIYYSFLSSVAVCTSFQYDRYSTFTNKLSSSKVMNCSMMVPVWGHETCVS